MKKIFLSELNRRNVTKKYVAWLNDYEVVKYTDQRNKKHTIKSVIQFVEQKKRISVWFVIPHAKTSTGTPEVIESA